MKLLKLLRLCVQFSVRYADGGGCDVTPQFVLAGSDARTARQVSRPLPVDAAEQRHHDVRVGDVSPACCRHAHRQHVIRLHQ